MSFLSQRVLNVKPSPTLTITQKAKDLRAAGEDIVNLAGGEPNFPTPTWIGGAAKNFIDQGMVLYTAVDGVPELKQAIIEKFKNENDLDFEPNQITVGTGSKQVMFNALLATLNEGDEVIIPAPFWVSYPDMVAIAGGTSKIIECPASQGFKMTAEQLEAAITPHTKWVILNSPSNPTGAIYTKEELQSIGEVLKKHPDVFVMSDDIYEHIIYTGQKFYTLAQVCPEVKKQVLTVNGVSKAYAMTGWRLGYAGGSATLMKAIKAIQSQSTSNPCAVTQAAGIEALTGPQEFLDDWRDDYKARRDFMVDTLRQETDIKIDHPDGAFYLYLDCSAWIGKQTTSGKLLDDDMDVAAFLLEDCKLAVTPGKVFGLSPYIRITYAVAMEELEKSIGRFKEAESLLR